MKNYTKKAACALMFVSTAMAMDSSMDERTIEDEFTHFDERMDVEAKYNLTIVQNEITFLKDQTRALMTGVVGLSFYIDNAKQLSDTLKEGLALLNNGVDKQKLAHMLSKSTGFCFKMMYDKLLIQFSNYLRTLEQESAVLMDIQGGVNRIALQQRYAEAVALFDKLCNSGLNCVTADIMQTSQNTLNQIFNNLQ